MSITAGGVGLNLTSANSVYVMEPQFNPAAEAQAVDRVHRLGQTREVRTVRYIMKGSFEEKMLELQDKKMKLASLSMDGRDKEGHGPDRGRQESSAGDSQPLPVRLPLAATVAVPSNFFSPHSFTCFHLR